MNSAKKDNQISHSLNANRSSVSNVNKALKWLSYYRPTVDLNTAQYHFISEPQNEKHQKVSIKNSQTGRPMTMYFEIQNYKQFQHHYINVKRQDRSRIKSFEYLDFLETQQEIVLNRDDTVRNSTWARTYQPKAFYDLLTEQLHNRNVLTWLKSWDGIVFKRQVPTIIPAVTKFHKNFGMKTNNNQNSIKPSEIKNQYNHSRLLLLSGPPGCGKTTLARVVARHCGYDLMELNASDDRSGKVLIEKIESMGKNNSVLNNKPTMIIIDEVDGALEQDGNGIKQVLNFIQSGGKSTTEKQHHKQNKPKPSDLPKTEPVHHQKHSLIPRPIIFICNDPFAKGLRQLRSKALVIYFRQVQQDKIVKRLKQITQKQKIYIQNQVLVKISEISNCDIRSSLSILEYICQAKRQSNQNPKELISRLKLSLSKDSNQSILQYLSFIMNQSRRSTSKQIINLRQFSYNFSKLDNPSLMMQGLFHNFIQYRGFLTKKPKQTLRMYEFLKWCDILLHQSFKYGGEIDNFVMMVFLYYKNSIINDEIKKVEFPSSFFERLNKIKHHKEIIHQLVDKWPSILKSTVSLESVIKDYLYVLYYTVQTSSHKDAEILDCVSKMITYGIQLASRNSPFLFKPEFDSLLTFGHNKMQVLYSHVSRNYIQESYQFAKLKSHLLADMSLSELNKNTEQLIGQLNIKNRRRKRNPESSIKNSIKYKFIQGSGTQITYDLKFGYFF